MFSRKTRYALMATTILARKYSAGPIPINVLATEENIPKRFLEGILLQLKNAGILDSTRGKEGGYFLAKAPHEITVESVIRECENAEFLTCICGQTTPYCMFNKNIEDCKLNKMFSQVYIGAISVLEGTTFADLV